MDSEYLDFGTKTLLVKIWRYSYHTLRKRSLVHPSQISLLSTLYKSFSTLSPSPSILYDSKTRETDTSQCSIAEDENEPCPNRALGMRKSGPESFSSPSPFSFLLAGGALAPERLGYVSSNLLRIKTYRRRMLL